MSRSRRSPACAASDRDSHRAARSGTRLEEIAHHYREGLLTTRMAGKAIGYTRRAAAQAMAWFAPEDAVENLEQVIELIEAR